MTTGTISLVPYNKCFLELSWGWLNDPEVRQLTMTPPFSREEQLRFFGALSYRTDYLIWGVQLDLREPIGAAGIKHIACGAGEYWGYIGEKRWWGRGLGGQILAEIESRARELGLTRLSLSVAKSNVRATKLYTRHGFELTSVFGEITRMEKLLS